MGQNRGVSDGDFLQNGCAEWGLTLTRKCNTLAGQPTKRRRENHRAHGFALDQPHHGAKAFSKYIRC